MLSLSIASACELSLMMITMGCHASVVVKSELTEDLSQEFARYLGDHINAAAPQYPSYVFRLTGIPAYMQVSCVLAYPIERSYRLHIPIESCTPTLLVPPRGVPA